MGYAGISGDRQWKTSSGVGQDSCRGFVVGKIEGWYWTAAGFERGWRV